MSPLMDAIAKLKAAEELGDQEIFMIPYRIPDRVMTPDEILATAAPYEAEIGKLLEVSYLRVSFTDRLDKVRSLPLQGYVRGL